MVMAGAALLGLCIRPEAALAAISLSVSPTSAAADLQGDITIQTNAATAGGSVVVQMFHDFNQDGVINADEWPLLSVTLQDNGTSSDPETFLADTDTTAALITSALQPLQYMPVGQFIFQATNENGETAQATANITAPATAAPLQITGKVLLPDTTTPVANAVVFCDDATDQSVSAAFSDQSGNFTIPLPTAGTYVFGATRPGYIGNKIQPLQVTANLSNYNLTMVQADAVVTGTVLEYGTNSPLPGLLVYGNTLTGGETETTTQGDGSFTLPVLADQMWTVGINSAIGYFGFQSPDHNYQSNPVITPSATNANVVNFTAHRETAWIEGTVLDESGTKVVEGALFYANRMNSKDPALQSLGNGRYTDANGMASVGLEPGDWSVGLCMNCHEHPTMVDGVARELVPGPQQTVTNLTANDHWQISLQTYYADGAIEGTVYQGDNCQTPVPAGVRVSAWSDAPLNGADQQPLNTGINTDAETDASGHFRIPVLGGSWSVQANMNEWNLQSGSQTVQVTTNGNDTVETAEVVGGNDLCLNMPIDNGSGNGSSTGDGVSGMVHSSLLGTPQPVVGATVQLQNPTAGQPLTTTSDGNGNFLFTGVPAGTYMLTITMPGLAPLVQNVEKVDGQGILLDNLPGMTTAGGLNSCDATGNGQVDLGDIIYWLGTLSNQQ